MTMKGKDLYRRQRRRLAQPADPSPDRVQIILAMLLENEEMVSKNSLKTLVVTWSKLDVHLQATYKLESVRQH